jgi:hypothetical protein
MLSQRDVTTLFGVGGLHDFSHFSNTREISPAIPRDFLRATTSLNFEPPANGRAIVARAPSGLPSRQCLRSCRLTIYRATYR